MASLAIIGSHSTNGVAKLHSDILKDVELHDFYKLYPERFNNKTNGIADRRWLQIANEGLANLIDEKIVKAWRHDLTKLEALKAFYEDEATLKELLAVKLQNKKDLAALIKEKMVLK